MSNLTNNTTKLQNLLTKINELPNSSGEELETLVSNVYKVTDPSSVSETVDGIEKKYIYVGVKPTDTRKIIEADTNVTIKVAGDAFGDAQASDVAAGKYFTSSSGLKVPGTANGQIIHTVMFDSKYDDNVYIDKNTGALIVEPPSELDASSIVAVDNFAIRITENNIEESKYKEMMIVRCETELYSARFLYTLWTGAVNPTADNTTYYIIDRSHATLNFDSSSKIFTLTPSKTSYLSSYTNEQICASITYVLSDMPIAEEASF